MNTTLSTTVDEEKYIHPPSPLVQRASARTVSLADRVALHLGLALITWSRRPRNAAAESSRSGLQLRSGIARDRLAREREWQLALYLSQQRR